jgi:hypothetical protein
MRVRLLALVLASVAPAAALAQYAPPPPQYAPYREQRRPAGPADQGLNLSARLGYGMPSGDISNDIDTAGFRIDPPLDDLIGSKIPIWLELGYRFSPTFWGGLYLELAPASVKNSFCPPGQTCSAANVRFGIDVQFHLAPHQSIDPWLGVGAGVEVLKADSSIDVDGDGVGDATGDLTYTGFEFPLLQAGLDFELSPRATIGPFISWSFGQYTSFRTSATGFSDTSGRITDRATHSWLEIGLKGTLKL